MTDAPVVTEAEVEAATKLFLTQKWAGLLDALKSGHLDQLEPYLNNLAAVASIVLPAYAWEIQGGRLIIDIGLTDLDPVSASDATAANALQIGQEGQ